MFIWVNLNIGHESVKMFLSLTFTFLLLIPVWAPPQSNEQELNTQITQLPALLNLAQTLSQASWGIQDSAFDDWVQDNPLDSSMETLRKFLLTFQIAVQNHIDGIEEGVSRGGTFPYFLSDNLKFTVISAKAFQNILYDCASSHGFVPYGTHFFDDVIDLQHLPSKIYISKNPIFRSVPMSQWQGIVSQNAEHCSIWQIDQLTKRPEVAIPQDCNQPIQSICIQPVGTETFSKLSEARASQRQLLASQKHLFYLLSQLSAYPSPLGQPTRFASDISAHLTEAFRIFAELIENETDVSYSTLFASQSCIELLQLALQKAQHSESWKTEERQQSNFEKIQSHLNDHSLIVKNIESRVQTLESNRRQRHRPARGGSVDTHSQGSGLSQHPSKLCAGSDGIGLDDCDDDQNPRDDDHGDTTTIATSDPTPSSPSTSSTPSNPSTSDPSASTSSTSSAFSSPSTSSTSSTFSITTTSGTSSDSTTSASNPNDANDGNATDSGETPWTFSSLFTWEYWNPRNRNSTEPDQENQLQYYGTSGNDSFFYPEFVYSNLDMVRFWPFSTLLTLAAFHLFAIIEFYINLLWKILTLLLAIHVYRLDRKVSRYKEMCDARSKPQANPKIDSITVKTRCSQHARKTRSGQPPRPPPDPQSAQPLLPNT